MKRNGSASPAVSEQNSRSSSRSRSKSSKRHSHRRRRNSRSRSRSPNREKKFSRYRSDYSRRDTRDIAPPSRCLGVFGLNLSTDEKTLKSLFSNFGELKDVNIVYDNYTRRSRGFGFIYFKHLSDAKSAKEELHGSQIDGRQIRIDYSLTKRPHSPTPGLYMGRIDQRYTSRRNHSPIHQKRYSRS